MPHPPGGLCTDNRQQKVKNKTIPLSEFLNKTPHYVSKSKPIPCMVRFVKKEGIINGCRIPAIAPDRK